MVPVFNNDPKSNANEKLNFCLTARKVLIFPRLNKTHASDIYNEIISNLADNKLHEENSTTSDKEKETKANKEKRRKVYKTEDKVRNI